MVRTKPGQRRTSRWPLAVGPPLLIATWVGLVGTGLDPLRGSTFAATALVFALAVLPLTAGVALLVAAARPSRTAA
jgi:hypothetical protein